MPNKETKVGDRIKVTAGETKKEQTLIGREFTVISTDHTGDCGVQCVTIKTSRDVTMALCSNLDDDWEVIDDPQPVIPPIGSQVKITERHRGTSNDSPIDDSISGLVGTVTGPYGLLKDKGGFNVKLENGEQVTLTDCDVYEILDTLMYPQCKSYLPDHAVLSTGGWTTDRVPTFKLPSQKAQPKGVSIMSHLTTLAKKAFDKPTKTLIQARVLNEDLSIRDEEFILAVLVDLNKDAIVKAAQERLDEEKTDSK